jgi:hypothetical protein
MPLESKRLLKALLFYNLIFSLKRGGCPCGMGKIGQLSGVWLIMVWNTKLGCRIEEYGEDTVIEHFYIPC